MSKVFGWLKEKVVSRKFIITVGAIIAAASGQITWDQAVEIAMVWLGAQGAVDAAKEFKKG